MIKTNMRVAFGVTSLSIIFLSILSIYQAFADQNTTQFNVNVKEVLSVSISTPTNWATGDVDTFLRNKVNVSVTTSNTAGFTASMTTKTAETALVNTTKNTVTLPTLGSNTTRANFPANFWGYSLDDTESGSNTSTYKALVGAGSTPITIISSNSASSGSKDFYFGAKANITQASGTYAGTVVINVVSGVVDDNTNPITPTDPTNPVDPPNTPTYDPTTNTTAYTYNNTNSTSSTTTTEISSGDNRKVYDGYTPPRGVISNTFSSGLSNTPSLMTGLALVSAVGLTSASFFLFAASRDEEEDEQ